MKRVIFTLKMPGKGSWNGRWSGENRRYFVVKTLTEKQAEILSLPNDWGYDFGDGWFALVSARLLDKGERVGKLYGFCGYEWMVTSILNHGRIQT